MALLRETPTLQRRRARARRAGTDKAAILDSLLTDIEREELQAQEGKRETQIRLGQAIKSRETGLDISGKRLALSREKFETGSDLRTRELDVRREGVLGQAERGMEGLRTYEDIEGARQGFDIKQARAARPFDIANIAVGGLSGLAKLRADERKEKRYLDLINTIRTGTPGY